MSDARDKPIERINHTDQISYIAAGTDEADGVDHASPYAEDAVFKGVLGPVHATAMNHLNNFWVLK